MKDKTKNKLSNVVDFIYGALIWLGMLAVTPSIVTMIVGFAIKNSSLGFACLGTTLSSMLISAGAACLATAKYNRDIKKGRVKEKIFIVDPSSINNLNEDKLNLVIEGEFDSFNDSDRHLIVKMAEDRLNKINKEQHNIAIEQNDKTNYTLDEEKSNKEVSGVDNLTEENRTIIA